MPSGPMQVVCTKTAEHPYDWLVNQHTGSDVPRSETIPTDARSDIEVYVGALTALPTRSSSHL